jgi:thioesterase domain-containing protein
MFWFNWGLWDFRLHRYLGSDQPVYGLQHQSQDGRRVRHKTIEQMATYYMEQLRAVRATGPYILGGYCIGGMVAFQMARQLQAQGENIALLVLLDPDPLNPHSEPSSRDEIRLSLSSFKTALGKKLFRHLRALAPLGLPEKLSYVLVRIKNRLTSLGVRTSGLVRTALCEGFNYPLPLDLRTSYLHRIYQRAAQRYAPKPYDGRVTLFKTQGRYHGGELGWGKHIAGRLEVKDLDTDHDRVLQEPYVQIFAEKLKARLSQTE